MAVLFDEFLGAICTQVKPFNANDFQQVFAITDPKEAKLAFDVLAAHGFDAKVYHEPNKGMSKLYITHPTQTPAQVEQMLAASIAYGRALKVMKSSLDQLCASGIPALQAPEYSLTFVNQPGGKQIMVQINPTTAAPAAAAAAPIPAPAAVPPRIKSPRVMPRKTNEDEMSMGPALGKSYLGILEGGVKKDTARQRAFLYFTGNLAVSSYSMLLMVCGLGILFSFFVFSKALLCPDFASMQRNRAWYCKVFSPAPDAAKQQQPLQPLEQQQRQP